VKIKKKSGIIISGFLVMSLILLSASPSFADNRVNWLDDIVVTGTRTRHTLQDTPVETILITREDIEKKNSQNILDILKDVPGIQTAYHDDIFGTYTWLAKMRGLDFDSGYALVLIDGQRAMGCGQSGGMGEYGVGLNQIPVEMIDHIEIVKGPGSALYGSDAMAGVINIITKKVPDKAMGSAGAVYGWYDVEKENDDGSIQDANGSRHTSKTYVSYGDRITDSLGYFLHYDYESADDISTDSLKSWRHSFLGKMDVKANNRTDISIKTELSDYEKDGNREEDTYRISGSVNFRLDSTHSFLLKGYTYDWDFTHGYPGYSYGYKYGNVGYNQGEVQYTWDINEWNTFITGGEAQVQTIDYIIENSDSTIVTVNKDVTTSSIYFQDEAVLFNKLTLVGGARYDDHSTFGSDINPKFSMMYQPRESTRFRASVGTSFKSPTIRQLYYSIPYRHSSFYARSNPNLKAETAIGYDLSVEHWMMNRKLMINLGYFRNEVEDMVIREDTGTLYNGLTLMEYRNVEKALTQGMEFMCRAYPIHGLTTSFSYTYTDTENKDSGKDLTYVPKHTASFSPAYDWDRYAVGASARISYVSRQYTNTANTSHIAGGASLDAKVYKKLSKMAKLSFEAGNIFDSAPSRQGRFHAGRTFTIKLDFEF